MRIVADTNTVISGLLWQGAPRRILEKARSRHIELITSAVLLDELDEVLHRDKFRRRLTLAGVSVSVLVTGFAALAQLIEPAIIELVIQADPDDDAVLACAIAAHANLIISGDRHLLDLRHYQEIMILNAHDALNLLDG